MSSKTNLMRGETTPKHEKCEIIYDFVVQKPGDRNTKNLDLQALFAQTKVLDL